MAKCGTKCCNYSGTIDCLCDVTYIIFLLQVLIKVESRPEKDFIYCNQYWRRPIQIYFCWILQWNKSKLNLLQTNFCVQNNRQVFGIKISNMLTLFIVLFYTIPIYSRLDLNRFHCNINLHVTGFYKIRGWSIWQT